MKGHVHHCTRCKQPFACAGEMIRNFDGFPEVVCDLYHIHGERRAEFRECESCVMTTWCEHCGDKPATVTVDGDRVCGTCATPQAKTA